MAIRFWTLVQSCPCFYINLSHPSSPELSLSSKRTSEVIEQNDVPLQTNRCYPLLQIFSCCIHHHWYQFLCNSNGVHKLCIVQGVVSPLPIIKVTLIDNFIFLYWAICKLPTFYNLWWSSGYIFIYTRNGSHATNIKYLMKQIGASQSWLCNCAFMFSKIQGFIIAIQKWTWDQDVVQ